MYEIDPDITNGTCYYKAGAEADEEYSPAGNAELGHTFCCRLKDKLNSHNACVQETIGYTYLAGCTDHTYAHPSCPYKANYSDYQWLGMVTCDDADANKLVTWVGCENDDSATPSISKDSEGCTCDLNVQDPDMPLFRAGPGLDAWGHLPDSKGEKIDWEHGYPLSSMSYDNLSTSEQSTATKTVPPPTTRVSTSDSSSLTTTSAAGSSSALSTTSTITHTSSSAAATSEGAASGLAGRPTGEKVGAGIGIGLLGIAAILMSCYGLFRLYKKLKKKRTDTNPDIDSEKANAQAEPTIPDVGDPEIRSPAWSGHKSELPGSPTDTATPQPQMLDSASTIVNSPSWSSMANTSPKQSSEQPVYRPFRYQPSTNLEGIQELPDHERPRWAQTDFGTYGPNRGYNWEHDRRMQDGSGRPDSGGNSNVHELPG